MGGDDGTTEMDVKEAVQTATGMVNGSTEAHSHLDALDQLRRTEHTLTGRFQSRLLINPDLSRALVSFQANKHEGNHWFKYKEGFSSALMRYVFGCCGLRSGRLLDPFAGSGTALFAAADIGIDATGIELLPSSAEAIEVKRLCASVNPRQLAIGIREFNHSRIWEVSGRRIDFPHLRITNGAFPPTTERLLGRYLYEAARVRDHVLSRVLRFAALSVLESISYTRKDGQYLRWDARSGRRRGKKPFHKGPILTFTTAVGAKLEEIARGITGDDLLFNDQVVGERLDRIKLLLGSCLDILPTLPAGSFDAIVTSPPYCNRYDYTRTYALELAMLGSDEQGLRDLRQQMLTCTVENREKEDLHQRFKPSLFRAAVKSVHEQKLLSLIVGYLESCRNIGTLNNNGIPRMVRNYFVEMALVIFECGRVLKRGAPLVMVNDNVRYQGVNVPVDLILSDIAEQAGFGVEVIWVLPRGKGNSSQQMGAHGREELRKCVYIWRAKEQQANRRGQQAAPAQ